MRPGNSTSSASIIANVILTRFASARVNATALEYYFDAAEKGNALIVEAFLKRYGDSHVNDTYQDKTALLCAINSKQPAIVKLLIEHGASLDTLLTGGNSYLSHACLRADHKTVACLLSHGMKIDALCMHRAACKGNIAIIDTLVAAGGDINARNEANETPLTRSLFIMRTLLSRNDSTSEDTTEQKNFIAWMIGKGAYLANRKSLDHHRENFRTLGYGGMTELLDQAEKNFLSAIDGAARTSGPVVPLPKIRLGKKSPGPV